MRLSITILSTLMQFGLETGLKSLSSMRLPCTSKFAAGEAAHSEASTHLARVHACLRAKVMASGDAWM